MMDIKHLLQLSKKADAKLYGLTRNNILENIQFLIENSLDRLTITTLSSLTIIGTNIKLNNPIFWNTLATDILKKANKTGEHNSDTLSIIYFNYVTSYPYIPNDFFKNLEKRLVIGARFLNYRSISQTIWSFSKRKRAEESTIKTFENTSIQKLKFMNYADLGQICLGLSMYPAFGTSEEFKKELEIVVLDNMKSMDNLNLIFVGKGLVSRKIFSEEFFEYLSLKTYKDMDNLHNVSIKEIAYILAEVNKDLELPFLERMQELKIKSGLVKEEHLY
ncbi:hypothetical protein SteCoe_23857 [Stentor coeruleus]|uniref:Uncharacterized protein n=1 Tax=Stentor coeruleus TaxID=5963 RepID=A0A1R2BIW9_9CILI|nr:hypothetical protein SteCoe_23857 [Stentor coeruleus]